METQEDKFSFEMSWWFLENLGEDDQKPAGWELASKVWSEGKDLQSQLYR